jgi:tRNA dimethylallyltransferase
MSQPVSRKTLVVVVGATAVGKTEIAVQLARHFGCAILSADSRQCYRELGIATAKPSSDHLAVVPHFFVDSHSVFNPVSVADFEKYALQTLQKLFVKHDHCIMVGGSGLYIKAITNGLDQIPDNADDIRKGLEYRLKKEGLPALVADLKAQDPTIIETLDIQNPRRVIRALEVCIATGKPYSGFLTGGMKPRSFRIVKIGLKRDRPDLYQRIDDRMDQMIASGLFEEAKHLYQYRHLKPLKTVGYQEIFGYMDDQYDREEAIRLLKRNSRRYAKRQLTWFGRDAEINWFDAEDLPAIMQYLENAS